jgi:hypothetical protein
MSRHTFTDPISCKDVVLCVDEPGDFDAPDGVEHPGCEERAVVSPDLDCFYCRSCGWNGRISGAWFMDMLEAEGS